MRISRTCVLEGLVLAGAVATVTFAQVPRTDIAPGTYSGWVRYRSDLSGSPPAEVTRKIDFDHCRKVFEDPTLPELDVTLLPGQDDIRTISVPFTGGTPIADVDVITDLDLQVLSDPPLQIWLVAPNGTRVFLRQFSTDAIRDVWDDETFRPASGELVDFETLDSEGPWTLTVHNDSDSDSIMFDFQRFHVRLHHDDAPFCETSP